MNTLLTRLNPKYIDNISRTNTALERSIVNILEEKRTWLDLTVDECDTLTIVLLEKPFTEITQIINLFIDE